VLLARYPADPSFYPDVNCEWLAFPSTDAGTEDVDEIFGSFEIYVFASPDDHVTVTNDDGTPLEKDPAHEGVLWFWDDDPAGGYWVAFANYPDNLQLVWYAGAERALGPRWERLDRVMTDLALGEGS
jgi:hypothetical protein